MKLGVVLTTVLLMAAPVVVNAQAHGGAGSGMAGGAGHAGPGHGSMAHVASWGPGFGPSSRRGGIGQGGGFHGHGGFDHHDHGLHDHDHDHFHGVEWGWGPYWGWGWSDCGAYGDACDWGGESGPGDASDDYGYTDGPTFNAACGAWLRHGAGYVWTRRACGGEPSAADPPSHAAVASNECSDWVWRADLHRSVCKRATRGVG